ncbi:MAG: head GIN domain-containing protein [Verrucomicrobiota bacterium]
MRFTSLPYLCMGLITIGGCNTNAIHGSGVAKTESRTVGSFSRIELAGSADAEVSIGAATEVAVTTDDNILPAIETRLEGDTLRIGFTQSYVSRLGVKVKITVPALNGVGVSGSGDIRVTGLRTGDLEARVTGSGDVTLQGAVGRLSGEVVGSGDLRAGDLEVKEVRVRVTGSGDATVRASEQLEASVTGSGDVCYYGNPPQVRKSVTGSGSIGPR